VKKSQCSEERIIAVLKQAETGMKVAEPAHASRTALPDWGVAID